MDGACWLGADCTALPMQIQLRQQSWPAGGEAGEVRGITDRLKGVQLKRQQSSMPMLGSRKQRRNLNARDSIQASTVSCRCSQTW